MTDDLGVYLTRVTLENTYPESDGPGLRWESENRDRPRYGISRRLSWVRVGLVGTTEEPPRARGLNGGP